MKYNDFEEVYPHYRTLQSFTPEQGKALADLLAAGVFMDGVVSREELRLLYAGLKKVPNVQSNLRFLHAEDGFFARGRLQEQVNDDDARVEYIKERCAHFDDEEDKLAVLRLIIMAATSDGTDELEVEYCYEIGHHMGLDHETIDDVTRAVWDSSNTGRTAVSA